MNGLTQVELDFYRHSTGALIELTQEVKKIREAVEKCTGRPVPSIQETPAKDEHPTDSPFDCLAVTKVEVFPFDKGPKPGYLNGMASVILNDQLQIRGLRIMTGENGLYVGYPADSFFKGEEFSHMFCPITRQLKEHIENCVLEKYKEVTNG